MSWLWKSKQPHDESCPISQFYTIDLELQKIVRELDSFNAAKEPVRCKVLVDRLRETQQQMLNAVQLMFEETKLQRASREYRLKLADNVQEDLGIFYAPLWFGAECLAAGSIMEDRLSETAELLPYARQLCYTIK
eukprot:Colp12_sorted_trinity150504_noHs@21680